MNPPFFSIIIPTYNRAGFIGKTIRSLLNQSHHDFEIIVVDDGSTDNTGEIVKSITDNRIRYFKKENAERGAARNFGTKKARGNYVNFFDSDDLAYPNHLEEAYQLISSNNYPEIIALGYDIKNEQGKIIRKRTPFKNINKQLIEGNLLSCNGVFIKKDIALQYPFSEIRELSASEDYLLWLQLAARYTFFFNNISTSAIIEHNDRSVLEINKEKLIQRKELMLQIALNDNAITSYYGKQIQYLKANTYSYIALHLAMACNKKESLSYLKKTLQVLPQFVVKKRFLAIVKYLLFV